MPSRSERHHLLASLRSGCSQVNSYMQNESGEEEEARALILNMERTLRRLKQGLGPPAGRPRRIRALAAAWTTGLVRRVLLVTLTWQVINIATLMFTCYMTPQHLAVRAIYYTILALQVLNLVVVLGASVRLTRQTIHFRLSGLFLAQCFVSAVLVFTGVYMVTFKLQPESFENVNQHGQTDVGKTFELFTVMLHFSCSTATLCGMSDVSPAYWYNFLLTCLQMLLSFVYFGSVLGRLVGRHVPSTLLDHSRALGDSASVFRTYLPTSPGAGTPGAVTPGAVAPGAGTPGAGTPQDSFGDSFSQNQCAHSTPQDNMASTWGAVNSYPV